MFPLISTILLTVSPAVGMYVFGMGFFNLFLVQKGVNHVSKPMSTTLYCFIISVAMIFVFYQDMLAYMTKPTVVTLVILFLFFVVLISFPKFIQRYKESLSNMAQKNQNVFILRMSYPYLLSKSFEIFFQQIVILALVISLGKIFMEPLLVMATFATVFGILHLPLIALLGIRFGLLFTCAAILSAFVFPPLILGFEGGFIYSYIAHWSFYLLVAILISRYSTVQKYFT